MKRAFYIASAVIIGTSAALLVGAWWHELKQADADASAYMRREHPYVSAAAKDFGDRVRRAAK